jgi:hypothetical protein
MSNPIPALLEQEVERYLARLDRALSILVTDENVKAKLDKDDFYTGLKIGTTDEDGGIVTTLYRIQKGQRERIAKLESDMFDLQQDVRTLTQIIVNMHKHLTEASTKMTYYNQDHNMTQNIMNKYGVF